MENRRDFIDKITLGAIGSLLATGLIIFIIPSINSLSSRLQNQLKGAFVMLAVLLFLYLIYRIASIVQANEGLETSDAAIESENMTILFDNIENTEIYDILDRNLEEHKSEIDNLNDDELSKFLLVKLQEIRHRYENRDEFRVKRRKEVYGHDDE